MPAAAMGYQRTQRQPLDILPSPGNDCTSTSMMVYSLLLWLSAATCAITQASSAYPSCSASPVVAARAGGKWRATLLCCRCHTVRKAAALLLLVKRRGHGAGVSATARPLAAGAQVAAEVTLNPLLAICYSSQCCTDYILSDLTRRE